MKKPVTLQDLQQALDKVLTPPEKIVPAAAIVFDSNDLMAEIEERRRQEEAAKAAQARASLIGDLEEIVKSVENDIARHKASVEALAEEKNKHLAHMKFWQSLLSAAQKRDIVPLVVSFAKQKGGAGTRILRNLDISVENIDMSEIVVKS